MSDEARKTPAQKAAATRKRRAAGKKAAATRKRRAAGRKAAATRKRTAAGRKVATARTTKTTKKRADTRHKVPQANDDELASVIAAAREKRDRWALEVGRAVPPPTVTPAEVSLALHHVSVLLPLLAAGDPSLTHRQRESIYGAAVLVRRLGVAVDAEDGGASLAQLVKGHARGVVPVVEIVSYWIKVGIDRAELVRRILMLLGAPAALASRVTLPDRFDARVHVAQQVHETHGKGGGCRCADCEAGAIVRAVKRACGRFAR